MNENASEPVVFISYSHDSPDHIQWVRELAEELKTNGVKVIFDKQNLKPGNITTHFMRNSIKKCDCVLMICTENYVERADAYRGGVGFENNILEGLALRESGGKEIIPIIRQRDKNIRLPESVSTLFGVNLSEGQNREEGITSIVERLHELSSPTRPPSGIEPSPNVAPVARALSPSDYPSDPSELYDVALGLTRSGDLASWNWLINKKRTTFSEPLNEWFSRWQWPRERSINDDLAKQINLEGLKALEPLFAVALAGVASRVDGCNRQEELVHDLLEPPSWNRSGIKLVVDFPETSVFVFQNLLGAFYIHSKQIDLLFNLANQRLQFQGLQRTPLWNSPYVVGWPFSLGKDGHRSCNEAWRFIWNLPTHIPWVANKLSSERRFRECLCGHYFLLSFMEFVDCLSNSPELLDGSDIRLAIPTHFSISPELPAALRSILSEKKKLLDYADNHGVGRDALRMGWPKWVNQSQNFLSAVDWDYFFEDENAYTKFMENLLE